MSLLFNGRWYCAVSSKKIKLFLIRWTNFKPTRLPIARLMAAQSNSPLPYLARSHHSTPNRFYDVVSNIIVNMLWYANPPKMHWRLGDAAAVNLRYTKSVVINNSDDRCCDIWDSIDCRHFSRDIQVYDIWFNPYFI